MRLSRAYIPTQKEIPSDAVMPSHQLMIRAGMIRPLASGVYSYLPLGWLVMKKIMQIIREEMDRIGAQELHLPVINPVELWNETGRNSDFGDEIFRLKDRKNRLLVLAPTHEEIICDLARKYVRSYKDMPQMWYQIQTKFRDEPRPRSGVIRTRQFYMKDSYSLDSDEKGLDVSYKLHAKAYREIFQRCGLHFHVVGASSGLMGGSSSQEFMIESEYGEDTLVLCENCSYASNMEIAVSIPHYPQTEIADVEKIYTPEKRSIQEVSKFIKVESFRLIKSLVYKFRNEWIMLLIRGDHELNESKLQKFLGTGELRPAEADEVVELCGAEIGFVGPIHLKKSIRIIADLSLKQQHDMITGANQNNYHLKGLEWNRDISGHDSTDIQNILDGEKCISCQSSLRVTHAIELGHIFKLGTKYSSAMNAVYLDEKGKSNPIVMGSYGIGLERIIAASIEQNKDAKGMVWNPILAPYAVHIIPLKMDNRVLVDYAEKIYYQLKENGLDSLIDDRFASPGFKFKDADLLGMPIQIIIGEKWLHEGKIEIKIRKTGETESCTDPEIMDKIRMIIKTI